MQFGMFYDSGCAILLDSGSNQSASITSLTDCRTPEGTTSWKLNEGLRPLLKTTQGRWERRGDCHPITAHSDLPQSSDPPANTTYLIIPPTGTPEFSLYVVSSNSLRYPFQRWQKSCFSSDRAACSIIGSNGVVRALPQKCRRRKQKS